MIRRFLFRSVLVAALGGALCSQAVFGQQQQQPSNTPAPSPAPAGATSPQPDKNCSWQATKGSKGGWKSNSTCPPQSQDSRNQETPSLAPAKDSNQQKPSPDETNPFPEAQSRKAQDAADGASSATKSPEPEYSSSHVDLKKIDEPSGSDSRISDGAGGFIHNPELAAQDDKVAKFYLQNGDFKGAYDRYKEATEAAPEDGDAVFGLAESARGLHKTQEAASNYNLYLSAFPDGKKSKEARKALAALGPTGK